MLARTVVAPPGPASGELRRTQRGWYFRYVRTLVPVACLVAFAVADVVADADPPAATVLWVVLAYVLGVTYQAIVVGTRIPTERLVRATTYVDALLVACLASSLGTPDVLNAAYLWPMLVASCFLGWRDVACVTSLAVACASVVPTQAGSGSSLAALLGGPIALALVGAVLAFSTDQARRTERELRGERELEDLVERFTRRAAEGVPLDASLRALELDLRDTFDVAHAWIDVAGIDRPRRALPGTAVVRVLWNDEQVARIAVAHAGGDPVERELIGRLERVATFVGAVIGQTDALRRHEAASARLVEADLLKDKFLAMASHELRTPLTSIRGFSETMSRQWEILADEDKLRFLAIVVAQSERLARLVEDVMLLSGIQSGRFELRPIPVRVEHAVERAIREHEGVLEPEATFGVDVRAYVDPDHLQHMLANLLDNAERHGAGPIGVSWDTWGGDVVITVADAGQGVGEELQARLFGEFQHDRGAVGSPGPGLGLSIVRTLARAHGGDAWYEPNVPAGSRFLVRLPAVPS